MASWCSLGRLSSLSQKARVGRWAGPGRSAETPATSALCCARRGLPFLGRQAQACGWTRAPAGCRARPAGGGRPDWCRAVSLQASRKPASGRLMPDAVGRCCEVTRPVGDGTGFRASVSVASRELDATYSSPLAVRFRAPDENGVRPARTLFRHCFTERNGASESVGC